MPSCLCPSVSSPELWWFSGPWQDPCFHFPLVDPRSLRYWHWARLLEAACLAAHSRFSVLLELHVLLVLLHGQVKTSGWEAELSGCGGNAEDLPGLTTATASHVDALSEPRQSQK